MIISLLITKDKKLTNSKSEIYPLLQNSITLSTHKGIGSPNCLNLFANFSFSASTYIGKKDVFEGYFPKMLSNFKEFHAAPEQFTDMKDHIMVTGIYSGVSNSGKSFEVSFSHVYYVQNNKIIQFRQFTDTQKIQESLH